MPIYEYECQQCGKLSEHWLRAHDPAPDKCPHCQGGPLVKQISLSSFHLKGSGWYATDYAKKNGGTASSPPAPKKEAATTESTAAPAAATPATKEKSDSTASTG